MSAPSGKEKLLSTVGLCARARKLISGTPMVCEALRKGGQTPVLSVLEASDTSQNTHEKLIAKCTYYRVPLYRISADTSELAHAIGKSGLVAAVGLTDANLLAALSRYLPEPTVSPETLSSASDTEDTPTTENHS